MMNHTGAGKRAALPSENATFLPGCFLIHPSALAYAVLYAASELTTNPVVSNGLLLGVAPVQDCEPPASTPLWTSVPSSTTEYVKVRASCRLGETKTAVHIGNFT